MLTLTVSMNAFCTMLSLTVIMIASCTMLSLIVIMLASCTMLFSMPEKMLVAPATFDHQYDCYSCTILTSTVCVIARATC